MNTNGTICRFGRYGSSATSRYCGETADRPALLWINTTLIVIVWVPKCNVHVNKSRGILDVLLHLSKTSIVCHMLPWCINITEMSHVTDQISEQI